MLERGMLRVVDCLKEFAIDKLGGRRMSLRGPRISVAAAEGVMHSEDGNWMFGPREIGLQATRSPSRVGHGEVLDLGW